MPMAMANLQIAQHRDKLRFTHTCTGTYQPKLKHLHVGQYVYLRRQTQNNMDADARSVILKVFQVHKNGTV